VQDVLVLSFALAEMAYDRFFAVLLDPSLETSDVDMKLRTSAADALAYLAGDKALEGI